MKSSTYRKGPARGPFLARFPMGEARYVHVEQTVNNCLQRLA
jgi:hypothetical protein